LLSLGFAPSDLAAESRPSSAQEISITVFKGRHELWLYRGTERLKIYRIFWGSSPGANKEKRGDNRTPIGNCRVVEKTENGKFHRFLAINYPNLQDADRAYDQGTITADDWVKILQAEGTGAKPPWNTPLGGLLGIHGIGENEKLKLGLIEDMDWTNGCIALTNREVDELYRIVPLGAPVRIYE